RGGEGPRFRPAQAGFLSARRGADPALPLVGVPVQCLGPHAGELPASEQRSLGGVLRKRVSALDPGAGVDLADLVSPMSVIPSGARDLVLNEVPRRLRLL